MVGIKGHGDVYQIWEEQIPTFKEIDNTRFRLYATFMKKGEARASATSFRDAMQPFTRGTKSRPWKVRVIPVKIKSRPFKYSGGFTVYCVYVERR
jgi:hypothetical protein